MNGISRQLACYDVEHPTVLLALALLSLRERSERLLNSHAPEDGVAAEAGVESDLDQEPELLVLLGVIGFLERAEELLGECAPAWQQQPLSSVARPQPTDLLR